MILRQDVPPLMFRPEHASPLMLRVNALLPVGAAVDYSAVRECDEEE